MGLTHAGEDARAPRIRIVFNAWANADDINAQSLTARELALRLDPARFASTMFLGWKKTPDPRLLDAANVRLVRVPPRFGSLVIARELLWGRHDVLFYPTLNARAYQLYRRFRRLGRRRFVVENVEASMAQMEAASEDLRRTMFGSIRDAELCVAITPAIARDLKDRFGVETPVIPLGVDLDLFRPVDRSSHQPPWKVLYVASIQPRKQTHLILELARQLRDQPVEFHIIGQILGDPAYAEGLRRQTLDDGLSNVFFHGKLSQPEIADWAAKADLFVLPSRLEGFGKATIEAAATGLPAVIFADYEADTVLDGISGYQVRTDQELTDAVQRLLSDSELRLRMGRAAASSAERFGWDRLARQWEAILATAIRFSTDAKSARISIRGESP